MCDKRPQTPQSVKSMVHGKSTRRQASEPCIYDVFCWPDPPQPDKNASKPSCDSHCRQGSEPGNTANNAAQKTNKDNQNVEQAEVAAQYQVGKPNHPLKPHPVKNELYMYERVKIRKNQPSGPRLHQEVMKSQFNPAYQIKLNEQDSKDKKIIEKRKQKLKQFNQFTRDLPNSAFTTYYGRPAFQSYGRCNSTANLKTHNVMPHRGQNHPNAKQTYQSALIKGKKVAVQNHLPRKPIEGFETRKPDNKDNEKDIHLPLQKPDLINHVRFSEPKVQNKLKDPVPSYEALKQELKKQTKRSTQTQRNKKNSDRTVKKAFDLEDGLKFMNTRDHLIDLIEAKKLKDSRLAYKVTECYPAKPSERIKTESDQQYYDRPAGITYGRGQPAENLIYRRY